MTRAPRKVEDGFTKQSNWTDPLFARLRIKAILLVDIMWKSPRLEMHNKGADDEARELEFNATEEIRCNALLRSTKYLQALRRYHNRNIHERSFNIGDMVLHRI